MEILVKSGGFSPEKDYSWVSSASPEGGSRIGDGLLAEFGVGDLFDDRSPSVVLARRGGVLLLLVTRLESNRTDYRGRHIRSMVAWRCGDDEEAELRGLAVLALKSPTDLQRAADEAVTRDDASLAGFRVDWGRLRSLQGVATGKPQAREGFDLCRVARNSEERRVGLAEELTYRTLPKQDGPLVIVTGNVGLERLEVKKVWRGLTSLVPWEDWTTPGKKKTAADRAGGRGRLPLVVFGLLCVGCVIVLANFAMMSDSNTGTGRSPKVTSLAIKLEEGKEVSRWTPVDDERWKVRRPRGVVTVTVRFDEPMDVTTTPSGSSSLATISVNAPAWSSEGTSCSFQVAVLADEVNNKKVAVRGVTAALLGGTPAGLFTSVAVLAPQQSIPAQSVPPFVFRVSGAKGRNGILMQPLAVEVEFIDR